MVIRNDLFCSEVSSTLSFEMLYFVFPNIISFWEILAFHERHAPILSIIALEMPVLMLINDGSNTVCNIIGLRRYHLLLGFLPVTCAISGNAGLQSLTLTTEALLRNRVTSVTYTSWLMQEVAVTACLSIGTGTALGLIAYCVSGWDFEFAMAILVAQIFSITMAGVIGTLTPVLCGIICKRDTVKWSGVFVTTFQDLVASFATVTILYHTVVLFSTSDADPGDRCVSH
jgi:Divalent cation transporter